MKKKIVRVLIATFSIILIIAFMPTENNSYGASKRKISKCQITLSSSDYTYTGKSRIPNVTVKYNGKKLTNGKSYTLSCYNTKGPGIAKIVIKAKKGSKYTGQVTKTYRINPAAVSKLAGTYNGADPSLSDSSISISWSKAKKCDYYQIVVKKDNSSFGAGTYTTKSTGLTIKNLNGAGKFDFTVSAIAGSKKVSSAAKTISVYAGVSPQSITATSSYNKYIGNLAFNLGARAYTSLSYKTGNSQIATVDKAGNVSLVGVGTTKITISAAASSSYSPATKEVTVKVNQLSTPAISVSAPGYRRIDVSWGAVSGASGYKVKEGSSTTTIASPSQTATSFYNKTKGSTYSYSVQAYTVVNGKTFTGAWSSVSSKKAVGTTIGQAKTGDKGATGNVAGDQSGREVCTGAWVYSSSNGSWKHWTNMARFKDPAMAERCAKLMTDACLNNNIGYDQGRNTTLTNIAKNNGYNIAGITQKCDTDCVLLVGLCINGAIGKWTVSTMNPKKNMTSKLKAVPNYLTVYSDSKYLSTDAYLKRGDILWTVDGCHCCIVL